MSRFWPQAGKRPGALPPYRRTDLVSLLAADRLPEIAPGGEKRQELRATRVGGNGLG